MDGCSGLCLVNLSCGWLILGWCCGFEIWDGADGFEICGCVDLSGCVCVCVCVCVFFFFKVPLVDVGLCRWWLVGVVAVGGRCCGSGECAIVVVDGDYMEEIIYYFNV